MSGTTEGGNSDTAGAGNIVADAGAAPADPTNLVAGAQADPAAPADPAKPPATEQPKTLTPEEQASKDAADKAAKEADAPPEKYEFKAAEGTELDAAAVEAISPLFKELGLNNEKGQKLIDAYQTQMKAASEKGAEAWKALQGTWVADARKDAEFGEGAGGQSFRANMSTVAKGRDAFGVDADLTKALVDSGMGNHPAIVRFFYRVGKSVSEGTIHTGNTGGGQRDMTDAAMAARLFKNTPQK